MLYRNMDARTFVIMVCKIGICFMDNCLFNKNDIYGSIKFTEPVKNNQEW